MPAAIDALVGTFTSTTFALIFGAYLTPTCIRRVFTTVLSIDTRGQFGDFVSLDSTGQCRLGQEVWSCSEMMKAVLSYDLGEYESEDELTELAHHAQAMIDPRKCLLASTWIFHGTLIVACYALLAFAWEMTTPTECPILLRTTMKPLRWFVVFTMTLATASGIMATSSGIAIALRLSSMISEHSPSLPDSCVGSGWIITLFATLGCLFSTAVATDLLIFSGEWREGQIALSGDASPVAPEWREKTIRKHTHEPIASVSTVA